MGAREASARRCHRSPRWRTDARTAGSRSRAPAAGPRAYIFRWGRCGIARQATRWSGQIEHNGAWQWQIGEHKGAGPSLAYVAALGPTDNEHHWRVTLAPGETFESVPAALAVAADGLDEAFGRLTRYRRAIRREHDDQRKLPVIFNDYMKTLMSNPSTERLLPLISAAASVGAEYFCIDAGWYAEPGEDWLDTVGEWVPSAARFTNGLPEVLDRIREVGMVPGLWIEPEVVGVRSPVADRLPKEAFFIRDGERVVERGRYHLDLRHPAARGHVDRAIDFMVGKLGVGYVKMDYNINVGPGTDAGGVDCGAGLLGHDARFWLGLTRFWIAIRRSRSRRALRGACE